MLQQIRMRVSRLKREAYALYLAARHPATPWYAKVLVALVVGYLFSPIDLIPDFIPVLGYLDDLLLVPLGIVVAIKLVPAQVLAECRERAREADAEPVSRVAAAVIVTLWLALAVAGGWWLYDAFGVGHGAP